MDRSPAEVRELRSPELALRDFAITTSDKLRYADTDRQGHVNNAVFSTFLETGRVEILYDPAAPLAGDGAAFVIARLTLDFRSELRWPGEVSIGTRVARVGRSSVVLEQGLFQDATCAAVAETVIVQMSEATRRSCALSPAATARLAQLVRPVRAALDAPPR
jgi:acyl-CoA thioester hydrolase